MDFKVTMVCFWSWVIMGTVLPFSSVHVAATDSDLSLLVFLINNAPSYTVDTGRIYTGLSLPKVSVKNNGPDELPAAASGNNYDVVFYLAESSTFQNPIPLTTFVIGAHGTKRADSLPVGTGDAAAYETWTASLTYPSDKCATYSHLCVAIVKDESATYIDNDPDNDYKCLPFEMGAPGTVAGQVNCPTDPGLHSFSVIAPADLTFNADTLQTITTEINLFNFGATSVSLDADAGDYTLRAYVCNVDDITNDCTALSPEPLDLSVVQSLSFTGWQTQTIADITIDVQLDDDEGVCDLQNYVCIKFIKGDSASYDGGLDNNLVCLEFGLQSDGKAGTKFDCPMPDTTTQEDSGTRVWHATYHIVMFAIMVTMATV
ncbi:uncharacterized protein LOC144436566 isoform X2 [Glandiceps talaboti]